MEDHNDNESPDYDKGLGKQNEVAVKVCDKILDWGRKILEEEEAVTTAHNTGSPKLFLLQVQDLVECPECSDKDKLDGIRLLIAEQLRAGT